MARISSSRRFVTRLRLFGCALPLAEYARLVESRRVRRIGFLIGPAPTLVQRLVRATDARR